ncbi:MAG: tetratricopeptide repeat protein [Gammaproteobacteria bacterium]|nr:MAG: tetratricopeptide repeat protein [Gammaproteobacteria bacterium]
MEQLNQAEEAFEAAQTLLPDQPQIAVQLAIINQEKGDHEKAIKILSKAAESHPNVPEIFLNQGYSLLTLGAVREAEHNFRIFMRMTERRAVYTEQRQAVKQWLGKAAFQDK